MLKKALLQAIQPVGVKNLRKEFGNRPFRLLDVGAGNHAATFLTDRFPNCEYYGIDITRNYNNDEKDFSRMKGFWEMDLTKLKFEEIPDAFFDVLYATHIIEHLSNGDLVLAALVGKLRQGGVLYVEYPRFFSTRFPSIRETLNFFDDKTHRRIYSIPELYNILMKNDCWPIRAGVRRNWYTVLLMPVQIPRMYFKRGYLVGADFWDLVGFAEYIFARKIK